MNPPQLNSDTEALLQGYLEGTLTPDESTRLLASFKARPELVSVLLDGLRMDSLIREVVRQTAAATSTASTTLLPESASEQRSRRREEADQYPITPWNSASLPRLQPRWNRPVVLALAAGIALLLGLGLWFLGPTMGEPVLAEVQGGVRLERTGQSLATARGIRLLPGDLLFTETNGAATVSFGSERTRLDLNKSTELKLTSLRSGKRFDLLAGRLEADVARQRPFRPMVVRTPNAEATVIGTHFTLTATSNRTQLDVTEGRVRLADAVSTNVPPVKVSAGYSAVVAATTKLAALPQTGFLNREWWNGVSWLTPSDSLDDPRFPGRPDGKDLLDRFEVERMTTNRFGLRLRGYVHPPVTGDYEFWLAGRAEASLFLSPSDQASAKVLIAMAYSTGGPRSWDKDGDARRASRDGSSRWSGPIRLDAGKRYYIEAMLTIPKGEGHLSVAWKRPGASRELLGGQFLSPAEGKK